MMEAKTMAGRWYYRCGDCLRAMAVDNPPANRIYSYSPAAIVCACGGEAVSMGKVGPKGGYLVEHMKSVCDARCTNAQGPSCDCACGGKNHGSQAVVTWTTEEGRAVVTTPPSEKMLAQLAEYRAARAPHQARLEALVKVRSNYGYGNMPADLYYELARLARALKDARKARSHKGRMKILAELSAKLEGKVA